MIFISAKLDILSIRVRDALLELSSLSKTGLTPAQVILWQLEQFDLEKEISLYTISPAVLKKQYPAIIKFQKVRYFFKNYLLLYRYTGECKKAISIYSDDNKSKWLGRFQILAQNELDLYCGDIFDRQIYIRNKYNLSIDNSYFAPIVDFLELFDSVAEEVDNNF